MLFARRRFSGTPAGELECCWGIDSGGRKSANPGYHLRRFQRPVLGVHRDVAFIGDTPIEKTSMARLLLTFVARDNDGGVLREDEIRKITIRFR